MTKGQTIAAEFIESFLESEDTSFDYNDLTNCVEESKARVKNWMSIRQVLAYFINEDYIARDRSDLNIERFYKKNNS